MGKSLEQTLHKERHTNGHWVYEKLSTAQYHWTSEKDELKPQWATAMHPPQMTKSQNTPSIKY